MSEVTHDFTNNPLVTSFSQPKCLKSRNQVKNYDDKLSKEGEFFGGSNEEVKYSYEGKAIDEYSFQVNKSDGFKLVPHWLTTENWLYTINLENMGDHWEGLHYQITRYFPLIQPPGETATTIEIDICTDEQAGAGNSNFYLIENGERVGEAQYEALLEQGKESLCSK